MFQQEDISDKELQQRWRLYWIHSVFEFSNIKLQRMSWIEGTEASWPNDEPWDSSYEECFSAYFDTLALDDAYAKAIKQGNVSKEEAEMATAFHSLLVLYIEPDENAESILKDPEWMELVTSAKEFWDYLKGTVTSQREIELMKKLENEYA
ncbi:MAG: hypothetical protein U9Q40_10950 [Campylobacterota bacterium]|nr:hypothetical protein [Campylobacterota bacterium]